MKPAMAIVTAMYRATGIAAKTSRYAPRSRRSGSGAVGWATISGSVLNDVATIHAYGTTHAAAAAIPATYGSVVRALGTGRTLGPVIAQRLLARATRGAAGRTARGASRRRPP